MTCDDALGPLNDRLDGPLAPEVEAALAAHLAGCEACRGLAEDLELLRAAAVALPREVQPERDLWPELEARLRATSPRSAPAPRSWWQRPGLLMAAAVVIAVGSSVITAQALRTEPQAAIRVSPPPPVAEARAPEAWEEDLDAALAELRGAVDARRDQLDPATLAVVEDNLRIIDAAVAQTLAALEEDPDDPALQRALATAGKQRLALLRQTLALTKEG